nr:immunoglobulin light chain junction region [Macaca mulatta]
DYYCLIWPNNVSVF